MLEFSEIMFLVITLFIMLLVTFFVLKNVSPTLKKSRKRSIDNTIDAMMEQRIKTLKEGYEAETEMLKKDKQTLANLKHLATDQTRLKKILKKMIKNNVIEKKKTIFKLST